MAVILNGITGGFSGKVGNIIGGTWKGISYMRSRATSISQPNTAAQLDQRARFGTVGKFLRPLIPFLRVGYKSQAVKKSGYNAAMAYNLENALTGVYPDYAIDYTQVSVSQGMIAEALNPAAVSTTAGEIDFSWEDNSDYGDALATDKAVLVVYNPAKKRVISLQGGNTRVSGSQTITVPASFTGDEVQCYISFQNANGSVLSNSTYVNGLIVV
ncbi:MAG TPA: hypothetical protein DCL77_20690 [Prolixibacteraceae bacterium]|jgi:hypothetical protein|nr:hypothetical protein [Prolixibacteraceae bacterium]